MRIRPNCSKAVKTLTHVLGRPTPSIEVCAANGPGPPRGLRGISASRFSRIMGVIWWALTSAPCRPPRYVCSTVSSFCFCIDIQTGDPQLISRTSADEVSDRDRWMAFEVRRFCREVADFAFTKTGPVSQPLHHGPIVSRIAFDVCSLLACRQQPTKLLGCPRCHKSISICPLKSSTEFVLGHKCLPACRRLAELAMASAFHDA